MSTEIKYIPLTFVSAASEKERLIRNTILFRHFSRKSADEVELSHYIESTQYGFNASAKNSGDFRFVRISDITDGEIAWDTVPFCDCDDPESYLLKKHDIVVARTGGTTGKSFLVSTPPKNTIYAGYLIRIRANSKTNPLFLSAFLNSYFYWSQITSLNRDEFRPSVNAEKLKALRLPKFDRAVQDEIVRLSNQSTDGADSSIRSELDSVLEKRRSHETIVAELTHQETLLGQLQQAILQEAIQGQLTADWRAAHPQTEPARALLQRIHAEKAQLIAAKKLRPEKSLPPITPAEIPFEIPKTWEWCRLGELVETTQGVQIQKSEQRSQDGQGLIRYLYISDFEHSNNLKFVADIYPEKIVKPGDLIVVNTGSTSGKIFRGISGVLSNNLFKVSFNPIGLTSDFLFNFVHSPHFKGFQKKHSKGTSNPHMGHKNFNSTPIPLPPLAEQAAIVERVAALQTRVRALAAELAHSRTHAAHLLQAVLQEAFTPATPPK